MAKAKSTFYYLMLCVIFSSIGSISSDLYLPSLPNIEIFFHSTTYLTQLTVTIFVIGFAFARLTIATISDAYGRKVPILFSLFICLIGSLVCYFAHSMTLFLLGRLIQGFGAGGANILARVILRDSVDDHALAKYNSFYSMAGITLMASAPLLGGYLQHYLDWQASFMVLIIYAIIAIVIALVCLPETNQHRDPSLLRLSSMKANAYSFLKNKHIYCYAVLLIIGYGVMVAWISAGSIILQKVVYLSAIEFGWCAALAGSCYLLGAFINSHLVGRLGIKRMLAIGCSSLLVAGIAMLGLFFATHLTTSVTIIAPVMLAMFSASLLMPNSFAAALKPFAKMAGIAVALLGTMQMFGGIIASWIIAWAPDVNQLPLGLVFTVAGVLALTALLLLHYLYNKHQLQH